MNLNVKYLIEGVFDIGDYLDDNGDGLMQDVVGSYLGDYVKTVEKVVNGSKGYYIQIHEDNMRFDSGSDNLKVELIDDSLFFYIVMNGSKWYITNLSCIYLESLEKLIKVLRQVQVSQVGTEISYSGPVPKTGEDPIESIDFKDLIFLGADIKNVNVKNLVIDYEWFKDSIYEPVRSQHKKYLLNRNKKDVLSYDIPVEVCAKFSRCILNNIVIKSTLSCHVAECKNITDYSFIKKVKQYLYLNVFFRADYPSTMNLQGLPKGNYQFSMSFASAQYEAYDPKFNEDDMWTFDGLPSTVSQIIIRTHTDPKYLFPHFSFKGIPVKALDNLTHRRLYGKDEDKSNVSVYIGASTSRQGTIRFGYKTYHIKQTYWKPNKLDLIRAIEADDLFLDFWVDGKEPNREYIPPKKSEKYNELTTKAEYKKYDIAKREEEEKANIKFLINKLKRTLKVGEKYYTKNNIRKDDYDEYLIITDMTDKEVKWQTYYKQDYYYDTWTRGSGASYTYEQFLNYIQRREFIVNNKTTKQLFGEYGHKRLLKLRKERKKEDRKNGLVYTAPKSVEEKPKKETVKIKPKSVEEKPIERRSDVEVVDYKERSYALFGNTYDIRQELKDMGAYYNKFLMHNGKKQPGWIESKKKKAELEKIIGQFD